MAVTEEYIGYVLDQLAETEDLHHRKMFGGVGIYSGEHFFAIIENDTLRFKVDDANRKDYEELGMEPFRPFAGKNHTMNYYQVPAEILEDRDLLRDWAQRAVDAAVRSKK